MRPSLELWTNFLATSQTEYRQDGFPGAFADAGAQGPPRNEATPDTKTSRRMIPYFFVCNTSVRSHDRHSRPIDI